MQSVATGSHGHRMQSRLGSLRALLKPNSHHLFDLSKCWAYGRCHPRRICPNRLLFHIFHSILLCQGLRGKPGVWSDLRRAHFWNPRKTKTANHYLRNQVAPLHCEARMEIHLLLINGKSTVGPSKRGFRRDGHHLENCLERQWTACDRFMLTILTYSRRLYSRTSSRLAPKLSDAFSAVNGCPRRSSELGCWRGRGKGERNGLRRDGWRRDRDTWN